MCWSNPAPAVIVTVELTGCGVVPPPEGDPPPHPFNRLTPIALKTSSKNNVHRRRDLKPRPHRRAASAASGSSGRPLLPSDALDFAVATVSVVEAVEPEGVTVAGEKLHVAPDGKPTQANETAEANPPCDVIVTVVVTLCPA